MTKEGALGAERTPEEDGQVKQPLKREKTRERERENEKEPGIENGRKPMCSAAFSIAAVLRSRRRGNVVKRKCRED